MRSVKQPYCFEVGEGEVFAFAGLWDEWASSDGEMIESCTVLTTGPNSLVADLHDRLAVIVSPGKYDLWLDPDVNGFEAIRDVVYSGKRIVGGISRNEITSAQWDTCERPQQVVGPKLVGGKAVR